MAGVVAPAHEDRVVATLNPQFRLQLNPNPVVSPGLQPGGGAFGLSVSVQDVYGVAASGILNTQYQRVYLSSQYIIVAQ